MPRKVLVAQGDFTFDLIEAPAENEHHLQEVMKNSPTLRPVRCVPDRWDPEGFAAVD